MLWNGSEEFALFSQLFIERQLKVLSPLSPVCVCVYENDNIHTVNVVNYIIGYI